MNKILFIGAILLGGNNYGGETIKNKIFLNYLNSKFPKGNLNVIDTFKWQKKILILFFKIFNAIINKKNKVFIVSSGSRGTNIFLKFYNIINPYRNRKVHLFVLGGAFTTYIKSGKYKVNTYKNIDKFYTETLLVKTQMEELGFKNVEHIPNWKSYSYLPKEKELDIQKPLQLFTFSKINVTKGTDLLIEAVNQINNKETIIEVDFYGIVDDSYSKVFFDKEQAANYFTFKGTVDLFEESNFRILSNYDAMVFPTFHKGEGVAGTIIDCFVAGVPVLASKWNFNSEVIKDGTTGLLFEAKSTEALKNTLLHVLENRKQLHMMRQNCIEEAKNYKIENLLADFSETIKNDIKT